MGTVPIPLSRSRPENNSTQKIMAIIDEDGYANEIRTLQEITVETIQSMLKEIYQREKADPEYCYVSLEDHIRLNTEYERASRIFLPPLGAITRIVNPITETLCNLIIQETFSRGTLMFYWRPVERQNRPYRANPSIISIVEK